MIDATKSVKDARSYKVKDFEDILKNNKGFSAQPDYIAEAGKTNHKQRPLVKAVKIFVIPR